MVGFGESAELLSPWTSGEGVTVADSAEASGMETTCFEEAVEAEVKETWEERFQ